MRKNENVVPGKKPSRKLFGVLVLAPTILIATVMPVTGALATSTYKTLHKCKRAQGIFPMSGLNLDQEGNLYGTTVEGGAYGYGVVFKLTPNPDGTWTEMILYSFCSLTNCVDGASPDGGLTLDQGGTLYGTTTRGGPNGGGTAFKLTPSPEGSWSMSVLYGFCSLSNCTDGVYAEAPLILDDTGNLYGTTTVGGAYGAGTVFGLTQNLDGSWTESVLYSFKGDSDGDTPYAGVVLDAAGNLYGATKYGGNHSRAGTVYKLAHSHDGSWTHQVLHRLCSWSNCGDGEFPLALVVDRSGNPYGIANQGGTSGGGIVFRLTLNERGNWTEQVLHRFGYKRGDGAYPTGLTFDLGGNLYGTTAEGGRGDQCVGGCGVVFKLMPNSKGTWRETVLHRFANDPGSRPLAGVIIDGAANLYGTTYGDLIKTRGSVFEIAP